MGYGTWMSVPENMCHHPHMLSCMDFWQLILWLPVMGRPAEYESGRVEKSWNV